MIQTISENVGWSCPKCQYCYSPITTDCGNCNRPDSEKYVTTTNEVATCKCGGNRLNGYWANGKLSCVNCGEVFTWT